MKVKIERADEEKTFKPFRLVIDVETLDEAKSLYHRTNLFFGKIAKLSTTDMLSYPSSSYEDGSESLWMAINRELKKQGYIKI